MLGNCNHTEAESSTECCSSWIASSAHQTHVKSGMRFPQVTPISISFRLYFFNSVDSCGSKLCGPATSCVKTCLIFILNLPAGSYVYNQVPKEWKDSIMHLSCYFELLWWHDGSGEENQRSVLLKTSIVAVRKGPQRSVLNLRSGMMGISWLWSEVENEQRDCKNPKRDGLTLTHVGAPEGGPKKQTDIWVWNSCGEKSLLPKDSSPASLAHAPEEFNIKHFGFHSKPANSMGINPWISLCFGSSPFKTSSQKKHRILSSPWPGFSAYLSF